MVLCFNTAKTLILSSLFLVTRRFDWSYLYCGLEPDGLKTGSPLYRAPRLKRSIGKKMVHLDLSERPGASESLGALLEWRVSYPSMTIAARFGIPEPQIICTVPL